MNRQIDKNEILLSFFELSLFVVYSHLKIP